MPVANYSPEAFAPGSDPSLSTWTSPSPSVAAGSELRAASITAASSIQPLNALECPVPFDTDPLIGSESISIMSLKCALPLVTLRNMACQHAFRPRQVPQD